MVAVDGGNPIARAYHLLYDIESTFRRKPGVGAGVSRREYRGLEGETGIETVTLTLYEKVAGRLVSPFIFGPRRASTETIPI